MSEVIHDLRIEKMSFGGHGVGRHNGLVVFVPFSAPQDLVDVEVYFSKPSYKKARILKIKEASPFRQEPACEYFGECGGCNWQHLNYETQIAQKQMIVEEQLKGILTTESKIFPIVRSPHQLRYRNRVQLKFSGQKLGFYRRKTHEVLAIQDCLITDEKLTSEFKPLSQKLSQRSKDVAKIELSLSPEGKVQSHHDKNPHELSTFSQVNEGVNKILQEAVLNWASGETYSKIYDLYSGQGNFTFPLSQTFPQTLVEAVELGTENVSRLKKRLNSEGISPFKILPRQASVDLYLRREMIPEGSLVLLDPPRTGLSEEVSLAVAQSPWKKLLYISCDPSALSRDLKIIFKNAPRKLKIQRVQAFDMFPQTDHVEALIELGVDS
jgi:23S rRNA (uracil1939-C5)-methyltransferase